MASEWNKKIRIILTIEDSHDSMNTKAGSFHDCLKARIEITGIGDFKFDQSDHLLKMIGTKFIWLAPCVGIVKLLYEHANNTRTEIELADYYVESGEPLYFPLSPGSRWQYQWQDKWVVHRELIRVFPREEEGEFVFSSANYMTGHE